MSKYILKIKGIDRTVCIGNGTVSINNESGKGASTMTFEMVVRDGRDNPKCDEEVSVVQDGEIIFGGRILKTTPKKKGDLVIWGVSCVDYTRDLDRNLVVEGYQGMTDKEIIKDIVDNYCGGTGITYSGVTEGVRISAIIFNYTPPSECISTIAKLTGRHWYIGYDKDIFYGLKESKEAPFHITGTENYRNLSVNIDNSSLRNRVYIRGGTYLSDETTIKQVADGEQTIFYLPEKPHEMSLYEGGVQKSVGIKNIDSFDTFDYLMSYNEKYVETEFAPSQGTVMTFQYKYDIPVLVAVEDSESIEKYGQLEYIIFDSKINTVDEARNRAVAELTDYADSIVSGSFNTYETGFRVGQYMDINLADIGVNERFIVTRVGANSQGGGKFSYTVKLVSSETKGIIQFLINLLESDKNWLNISADEVVDEINTVGAESFSLVHSVPVLVSHDGTYEWDDAEWNFAEWSS